ncbi:M10 family metallopeptidase C-terminal domain-containing protein [Aestuariivirga sp.]|uniref:M10 family metallopeptidase C-terminal domain-containing protein n=1 Tax=Aestuariivirga sp. TaxID=2650926 RepID=UPI0035930CA9
MSQTRNTEVGASRAYTITTMAADIEALRHCYGSAAFLGDTTYGFDTDISAATSQVMHDLSFYADKATFTIVDDGGYDTLNFSGYSADQYLDLTVVSADDFQFTNYRTSNVGGLTGNMTLAVGTVIERAYTGSGNDWITGNAADNQFSSFDGTDIIDGRDILTGSGGADQFVFADVFGKVTIRDFSASNTEDIDLSAVSGITGFADLLNNHLQTDGATGFAMIVAGRNSILLTGITVDQIGTGQSYSSAGFVF